MLGKFAAVSPTLLVLLLVNITLAAGAPGSALVSDLNRELTVSQIEDEIEIDGQLGDGGWRLADVVNQFTEHYPGDQTKPAVETKALVTFDQQNLYVAFVCSDNPAELRASVCERDKLSGDDYVEFCLDTYGDAAFAYVFRVNPYGIQEDAIWASSGGEEIGYDLIWKSAGMVTDTGYQIELAIPFASLRFSDEETQTWKADFGRMHPREVPAEYAWTPYDRDENCWPCQWGTLNGIAGVRPGRGIEIAPAVVGTQSGTYIDGVDGASPGRFANNSPEMDVSMWAKYDLSSNATAEITLNPDFSQIEADAGQIDVNTTFALFYPERRPFFQEGNDIFRTPIRTLYTRAINDPEYAGKATVRSGRTSLAYLFARDRESVVYLPSEERSFGLFPGKSTSNILRLRQAVADGSQVGLVATDQRFEGGWSNSTLTSDGRFRLTPSLRALYQVGISYVSESDDSLLTSTLTDPDSLWDGRHTRALDGESYWGYQDLASITWWSSDWNVSLTYLEASPAFHHHIALIRQNHYRNIGTVMGHFIRPQTGIFETINPHIRAESEWNWDGKNKYTQYELCLWTRLRKAQGAFYSQYVGRSENFGGKQYDNTWYVYQDATLSFSEIVSLYGAVTYGHRIARRYNTLSSMVDLNISLDLKPHDRLLVQQWLDHARATSIDESVELYDGFIWRTRLNYQLSRPLSARLVVEYDDFLEQWRMDPLVTYRINPFSVVYAGMTSSYLKFDSYESNEDRSEVTRLASRQFFLKLQYLFRM